MAHPGWDLHVLCVSVHSAGLPAHACARGVPRAASHGGSTPAAGKPYRVGKGGGELCGPAGCRTCRRAWCRCYRTFAASLCRRGDAGGAPCWERGVPQPGRACCARALWFTSTRCCTCTATCNSLCAKWWVTQIISVLDHCEDGCSAPASCSACHSVVGSPPRRPFACTEEEQEEGSRRMWTCIMTSLIE